MVKLSVRRTSLIQGDSAILPQGTLASYLRYAAGMVAGT